MENVVSCYLMGGLGNQLFQIFATISYGIKNNHKILFPYDEVLTTGRTRNTYWDTFLKGIDIFTTRKSFPRVSNDQLLRLEIFRENGFEYENLPINKYGILFYGYFQSYKYFYENEKRIFLLLQLKARQESIKTKHSGLFNDCHTISMHFRLGDYKHLQHFHPIMPYEYYKSALNYIIQKRQGVENIRVLYFCEEEDNEEVLNTILRLQKEYSLVEFQKVDDKIVDWEQMLIMSCCNDNIIANSSFSWWGGYFNRFTEKIVCYPSKWFGPANVVNTKDLFPETWSKIIM
jgi:hypothetical protein